MAALKSGKKNTININILGGREAVGVSEALWRQRGGGACGCVKSRQERTSKRTPRFSTITSILQQKIIRIRHYITVTLQ